MGKDYRLDNRTKEQFAADIKAATAIEQELMKLYVKWLNNTKGGGKTPYSFVDNGVDNTGEYLEEGKAHAAADFILKTEGKKDKLIEIKFSREYSDQLHVKIDQLKKYLNDKVNIVIFMNLEQNCCFTFIPHSKIKNILQTGYKCKMWNKDCIRLYSKNLLWQKI